MQHDTPDYIRRGAAAARHRIAPLELFSDPSPPQGPPSPSPANGGAALEATSNDGVAAPQVHPPEGTGGGEQETTTLGSQSVHETLHIEENEVMLRKICTPSIPKYKNF
jgi:hypothetical protein